MSTRMGRLVVGLLVTAHIGFALMYTLPRAFVPDRVFYWSQHYMRPIFHQQWNLFAPDPPICACRVEVGLPNGTWRSIAVDDRHYLVRRMARPLADHVYEQVQRGDTLLIPVLSAALRGMVRDLSREVPDPRYRSVARCITDPADPWRRTEHITPLRLSPP